MSDRQLGVLLACFDGSKTAGKTRRSLDKQLRAQGDDVLDTVVLKVDAKHKASEYDPRLIVAGTFTAAFTWGVFGLVLGSAGVESGVIWAVIGAACGGLYALYRARHVSKAHIGSQLPARSSALAIWAETKDARRLLEATTSHQAAIASVAAISDDLTTRVFAGVNTAVSKSSSLVSMIVLRYPSPETAGQMAAGMATKTKKNPGALDVELVIRTDGNGRRHVTDPKLGAKGWAKSDAVSWGALGLIVGVLSGLVSGNAILDSGIVTGIVWGIFGVFAGALYGLWAGRSISARRLRTVGPLLAPGTSMILAWAGKPTAEGALDAFITPESQQLILRFNPVERGAVLDAG